MGSARLNIKKKKQEKIDQKEKAELVNQCLGNNRYGNRCEKMLPKGIHLCPDCQDRINLAGKIDRNMSSGNGYRLIKKSTDNTI